MSRIFEFSIPVLASGSADVADAAFWSILLQLVLLLSAALLMGMLFGRAGQSAILGYLLAGTLMGPAVLNVVHAESGLPILAELGVSLLLFAIGLEFSAKRLLQLGRIGLAGGSLQVALTLALASGIALASGFSLRVSLAIGAMAALSSTACVLRVLIDRGEMDSVHGRSSLGILLLQDVAVVPLVLLVTMLGGAGTAAEMGIGFLKAVGLVIALVGAFYILSNYLLPRLLKSLNLSRDRELLILLAVALAMGSALAAHSLKISPALGAFIAGILLAESPFSTQIRSDISALRALFITLFFASVGMLGDPVWIFQNALQIAVVVGLIVIGKAVLITAIAMALGRTPKYAAATGISLAQVGEFGVVIAGIAQGDSLLDDTTFRLLVSATLISLFLTPFLVRSALPLGGLFERCWYRFRTPGPDTGHPEDTPTRRSNHVIVVGFGPCGQRVAAELASSDQDALIFDLRPDNVDLARSMGFDAILGDATNLDVLVHHGIARARAIAITVPSHREAAQIAASVRTLAPGVHIIVRARYHNFVDELESAGATVVINEEFVTGNRLAAAVRSIVANSASERDLTPGGHDAGTGSRAGNAD